MIGETQDEIRQIFEQQARVKGSPLYYAEDNSTLKREGPLERNKFIFNPDTEEWIIHLETQFTSPFQFKNLTTALYTLYLLRDEFNLDVNKIADGIKNIKKLTYFIGRWSIIRESPRVIYDSAHNIAGVKYLVEHVQKMKFWVSEICLGHYQGKRC